MLASWPAGWLRCIAACQGATCAPCAGTLTRLHDNALAQYSGLHAADTADPAQPLLTCCARGSPALNGPLDSQGSLSSIPSDEAPGALPLKMPFSRSSST
jgi:hypothetical protein